MPYAVRVGRQGGAEYYYSTDHIGSVMGLVRADGTLANAYQYGPWGEALAVSEAAEQPLHYAARELDPVTGLYYVRARWYDPHQGRFVSEDPIGLEGGLNLYTYAANSPTNFTDPSGMCPKPGQPGKDVNKDGIIDKVDCFNGGLAVPLTALRVVVEGPMGRSLMSMIGSVGRAVSGITGGSGGRSAAPDRPKKRENFVDRIMEENCTFNNIVWQGVKTGTITSVSVAFTGGVRGAIVGGAAGTLAGGVGMIPGATAGFVTGVGAAAPLALWSGFTSGMGAAGLQIAFCGDKAFFQWTS